MTRDPNHSEPYCILETEKLATVLDLCLWKMEYNKTQNLTRLASIAPKLPLRLREAIEFKAAQFFDDLADEIGEFMCGEDYGELFNVESHSEETIRTLVQCVPEALKYDDERGNLPIHHACYGPKSVPFVPLLAEEGLKHNVGGGEEMRGGILCKDDDEDNVLRCLALFADHGNDMVYLNVLKRLRKMGFFKREDITEYNLLWCFEPGKQKAFKYLVEWDPTALKKTINTGESLLHCRAECGFEDAFEMALNSSLKHYPRELGFLLLEDDSPLKNTPISLAKDRWSSQKSWEIIRRCLDNVHQPKKILEKYEEENTYTFMLAATGDNSDLDLVYYLARRNPFTLIPEVNKVQIEVFNYRKRKR